MEINDIFVPFASYCQRRRQVTAGVTGKDTAVEAKAAPNKS